VWGGTIIGVGGRGPFRTLEPLLDPMGSRGMNLGESPGPGTLAALQALCGGHDGAGPAQGIWPFGWVVLAPGPHVRSQGLWAHPRQRLIPAAEEKVMERDEPVEGHC